MLVAGVKVATQTPPIRSGRRVVFLTLDDATGPVDATFFEDAQGPYAATVFHSWLLVVRGVVRRTGPRGVSVRATGAWELSGLFGTLGDRRPGRRPAVMTTPVPELDRPSSSVPSRVRPSRGPPGRSWPRSPARVRGRRRRHGQRRVLVHASGFRQSPYADVRPPGEDVKKGAPPRKLWHSSPGSSGG